jgi:hypothetical protein
MAGILKGSFRFCENAESVKKINMNSADRETEYLDACKQVGDLVSQHSKNS